MNFYSLLGFFMIHHLHKLNLPID